MAPIRYEEIIDLNPENSNRSFHRCFIEHLGIINLVFTNE